MTTTNPDPEHAGGPAVTGHSLCPNCSGRPETVGRTYVARRHFMATATVDAAGVMTVTFVDHDVANTELIEEYDDLNWFTCANGHEWPAHPDVIIKAA